MGGGTSEVQEGITIGINWGEPKTSLAIMPSSSRIDQASSPTELLGSVRAICCTSLARRGGTVLGNDPVSGFPPRMATMQRALIVRSNCAVRLAKGRADFG